MQLNVQRGEICVGNFIPPANGVSLADANADAKSTTS